MFEVPGSDVKSVHITEECVRGGEATYEKKNGNDAASSPNEPEVPPPTPSSSSEEEENTKVRVKQ